jgi:hypothetical protein
VTITVADPRMTVELPADERASTVTVKYPAVVVENAPPPAVGPDGETLQTAHAVMSEVLPFWNFPVALSVVVTGDGVGE